MFEGSGDMPDAPNSTPTMEVIQEEPIHPDLIETVAFCKNIRNVQVLTEAVRGFQGTGNTSSLSLDNFVFFPL